jgi:hypothetical protein
MSGIARITLISTAAEIRAAESVLNALIADLQDKNVWSGADADRFQREWHDLVSARLLSAAHRVDTCSLIEMP